MPGQAPAGGDKRLGLLPPACPFGGNSGKRRKNILRDEGHIAVVKEKTFNAWRQGTNSRLRRADHACLPSGVIDNNNVGKPAELPDDPFMGIARDDYERAGASHDGKDNVPYD